MACKFPGHPWGYFGMLKPGYGRGYGGNDLLHRARQEFSPASSTFARGKSTPGSPPRTNSSGWLRCVIPPDISDRSSVV